MMAVWICDVCGNDGPPCRLDGGEDAGEPLCCPWLPSAKGDWRTEGDA